MPTYGPLRILLVDDEAIVHQTLTPYLRDLGHTIDSAYNGKDALSKLDAREYDIALLDVRLPGMDGLEVLEKAQEIRPALSCVIITGHGSMATAIQALRLGAADLLTKPIKLTDLDAVLEKAGRVRGLLRDRRHLKETIRGMQAAAAARAGNRQFVGKSRASESVRERIAQAVEANCDTILITGETGTGKEVVAREIHFRAAPEDSPFIAVSCPALPETLVEGELFGHVKGSFTGASVDRPGYFELADGGTLFLDEIADLSAQAQATLLRVLETRCLRRVGGADEIQVDVRVVAATNVALERLIDEGRFRPDLYYRLNRFAIHLPPLRERRQDILPIAEHFLALYAESRGKELGGFTADAVELLEGYDYPGNARELRNVVESTAMLVGPGPITASHLRSLAPMLTRTPVSPLTRGAETEEERILAALDQARWNRREACKLLDMPYSTLRYKMRKLGI